MIAVDGLDLSIEQGTITGILGPNGAGKTTTIETCEGFRAPHGGSVRVLGLDPQRDAHALRPRVGVMLQSGGAWAGVRASEMLRHVAAMYAHPLDIATLSRRLGIDEFARTTYRRLSGGQQQRLNLAIALVGRPELVFLDEPTAGLDPHARHDTWDLLHELRDQGVSSVLTTHFLDEAETLCDVVHIIDRGRLIASGTPAELGSADSADTLRLVVAGVMDVDALSAVLPDGSSVHDLGAGRYEIRGRVDPAVIACVTAWSAERGLLVRQLAVGPQSLEDRFLELTAGAES